MISSRAAVTVASVAAVLIGAVIVGWPAVVNSPQQSQPAPEPPPVVGLTPQPGRFVSAWLPYWKVDEGLASFTANSDLFTDLTTFFHYVSNSDGAVVAQSAPGQIEVAIGAARERGVPALAAVLDDAGRGTMREILLDPARRAAHIQSLLPLVDELGYDGIDIDYENFAFADSQSTWAETRPAWVAFITELGAELRARGKYLTVAVPPQFDGGNGASSGYWVYDWPSIAPSVDTLRVMTYDYSTSEPGPIGPLPWVERTTAFGIATVGPEKFRIGIATYGRDWVLAKNGGSCGMLTLSRSVTRPSAELLAIATANGATVSFDESTAEAAFTYRQQLPGCDVDREVHFVDAQTVSVRANLALANGTGVALWSLGGEDPATWQALREAQPPPAEAPAEP